MSAVILTKTVLRDGIWHGEARRADGADAPAPELSAWVADARVAAAEVKPSPEPHVWEVRLDLPRSVLSDGARTVLIRDEETGQTAAHLTVIAGAAAAEDLRAEVELLRAELDMLKRAFRRHCLDG